MSLALLLAACSGEPLGRDVVAQAHPGGKIAFDVVKLDDAVLTTVLAQPPQRFDKRFKKYQPPAELKVAVGDMLSVVVWESGANGLFGTSLTELSFPGGALAQLRTGQPAPLEGVPTQPLGLGASVDALAQFYGGAAAADLTDGAATEAGQPTHSRKLQQFLDVATQSGRPGTRIPDQEVGTDGAISVPYAGRIAVAGQTPEQVEHRIERLLAGSALDPQALVVVSKSAANSVSVAGEVIGGARVPLSPGGDRLLQVIAAAGGADAPVHDTFVQLSRDGTTATVPLATLVSDPAEDIYVQPGDVLTLVKRPQTFSVFGATGKNAAITFTSDRMSLTEALAKAGGLLDDKADPRAVFLFRYEPVGLVQALGQPVATNAPDGLSPVVYRLDLHEAKSYLLAERFPVRDKDIIFVAQAESQPVYRFFQALSQITGPIQTGLIVCNTAKNC